MPNKYKLVLGYVGGMEESVEFFQLANVIAAIRSAHDVVTYRLYGKFTEFNDGWHLLATE